MMKFDRLPALPLVTSDPYLSIWLPADLPTEANTQHWCGEAKRISGHVIVDGIAYRYLGNGGARAAETMGVHVRPTTTCFEMKAGPVSLNVCFRAPAIAADPDLLSTPVTFVDYACVSLDGEKHDVEVVLNLSDNLCYDGAAHPAMMSSSYCVNGLNIVNVGRKEQKVLCHSGDHITIDWGYLYVASAQQVEKHGETINFSWKLEAAADIQTAYVMIGYDDVASINYFGVPCRAWYTRGGKTIQTAMLDFAERYEEIRQACAAQDEQVLKDAFAAGGEDYQKITAAAWRHTFAAHKLIATPKGEMAFLSKENDSNGCIGTVDVSYPSTPLFLKYNPELVNALCRPVMEFASMPVWKFDFAPHDVGRYPQVLGQVYGAIGHAATGEIHPYYFQYPAEAEVYQFRGQMPVEESGNMLVMLWSAIRFGADDRLAGAYLETLKKWVNYLDTYGEDPGEQLCTDDFAGHLNHNVNLAAKAIVGVACYAQILEHFGQKEESEKWMKRAHEMAESWQARACAGEETPLTFDGKGWSMKYNWAWDRVFGFGLMPESFYEKETKGYLKRMNPYGLPLDNRADYTKSDWFCWCAAMAGNTQTRRELLKPLVKYLNESQSRVAFSDWYDTVTGRYVAFIGRSVQGGVFMPMLID